MPTSAIKPASYKVRARGLSNCPDTSVCRMEISVGQQYHEGDKLAAALDWAERFEKVYLLIGDSPQRFNLMYEQGLSEPAAEALARQRGDQWLERNKGTLGEHPRFEVTRWNDWKLSADYINTRWQIGRLYRDLPEFSQAIDEATSLTFSRRGYKDWERFSALSRQYLLEESAVFALAYGKLGGFSAYPGSFLDTWDMFTKQEIPDAPAGFRNAHHAVLGFDHRAV